MTFHVLRTYVRAVTRLGLAHTGSVKVTIAGDDGARLQVYRVRCRWLPWKPGTPRVAERFLGFYGKSDGGSLGGLSGDAGAVVLVVLLVPLIVAASLVLGELALLLLALPLLALWRVLLRRPWLVYVARNGGVIHVERASTFTAARKRRNEIAAGITSGTWWVPAPEPRHSRGAEGASGPVKDRDSTGTDPGAWPPWGSPTVR